MGDDRDRKNNKRPRQPDHPPEPTLERHQGASAASQRPSGTASHRQHHSSDRQPEQDELRRLQRANEDLRRKNQELQREVQYSDRNNTRLLQERKEYGQQLKTVHNALNKTEGEFRGAEFAFSVARAGLQGITAQLNECLGFAKDLVTSQGTADQQAQYNKFVKQADTIRQQEQELANRKEQLEIQTLRSAQLEGQVALLKQGVVIDPGLAKKGADRFTKLQELLTIQTDLRERAEKLCQDAQIALKNLKEASSAEATELSAKIAAQQAEISAVTTQNGELQKEKEVLQKEINTLKRQVTKLDSDCAAYERVIKLQDPAKQQPK
jgi:hypothetical protein